MSFYRIFPGLSILVRGWKRGRRPRSRTPRRASAHRAPERSEGKRTGGRVLPVGSTTPGRAVRAPTEGRGGPGGSRAVGCADHARASGRDAPPYALLHFGADFSTFRVETHFSQGAHGFPMAHLSLFQWAIGGPRGPRTPGFVVALGGRWPTGRGPCVTRGPHIPTALLAPSGRSTGGLSAQYNGGAGSAPRSAGSTRACTHTA